MKVRGLVAPFPFFPALLMNAAMESVQPPIMSTFQPTRSSEFATAASSGPMPHTSRTSAPAALASWTCGVMSVSLILNLPV
jgi:hypothetical protein